jgi:hypothetical protein
LAASRSREPVIQHDPAIDWLAASDCRYDFRFVLWHVALLLLGRSGECSTTLAPGLVQALALQLDVRRDCGAGIEGCGGAKRLSFNHSPRKPGAERSEGRVSVD